MSKLQSVSFGYNGQMKNNIPARILADIAVFLAIFIFPYWLLILLATAFLLLFRSYYEYVVVFLIADIVYGTGLHRYHGFAFVMSAAAIVVFAALELLKKRIIAYD